MQATKGVGRQAADKAAVHAAGGVQEVSRAGSAAGEKPVERVASAVIGGALMALGLRRRSPTGAALALASGALLYRGIRGTRRILRSPSKAEAPRDAGTQALETEVERAITIRKAPEELYRLWRDPEILSQIMEGFAEITAAGADRVHWKVHGPLGQDLEWDSRFLEVRPGSLLRWESLEGAELPARGSVHFHRAPGEWGTEVTLRIGFNPPGGALGHALMKRLQSVPSMLAVRALRRFKAFVEAGEIPTLEHNPSARRGDRAN